MQNKTFIPPERLSSKSFTLIELIVVIIIVGILAAVGISQYSKMVEKGRGAEVRMVVGQMRQLAHEYYLQNGTVISIINSDLNIGTASDQIPGTEASDCRSTHYFHYKYSIGSATQLRMWGRRCTSGGQESTRY